MRSIRPLWSRTTARALTRGSATSRPGATVGREGVRSFIRTAYWAAAAREVRAGAVDDVTGQGRGRFGEAAPGLKPVRMRGAPRVWAAMPDAARRAVGETVQNILIRRKAR